MALSSSPWLARSQALAEQDQLQIMHLLMNILQSLPQKDRLQSAALVSQLWAIAAAQATQNPRMQPRMGLAHRSGLQAHAAGPARTGPAHRSGLQASTAALQESALAWVQKHAQQLKSLVCDFCNCLPDQPGQPATPASGVAAQPAMPGAPLVWPTGLCWARLRNLRSLYMDRVVIDWGDAAACSTQLSMSRITQSVSGCEFTPLKDDPSMKLISKGNLYWAGGSHSWQLAAALSAASTVASAAGKPGRPVLMPHLQDLALINCAFADSSSIMQLAAFTGLTSLKLQVQDDGYTNPGAAQLELSVKLLCILPQLQQLQHLSVAGIPLPRNWQATALSRSSRLVSLDFTDVSAKHPTSAGSAAAANTAGSQLNLSSLQRLSCSKSVIPGSIFAGASHLTSLEVSMLVSGRVDQMPRLSPIGTATALVSLQLCDACDMADMPDEHVAQFTALTASTRLVIEARGQDCSAMALPRGAIQHMFPAGRQYSKLERLQLQHAPGAVVQHGLDPKWCLTAEDIRDIACACPGLHCLDVNAALEPSAGCVSALLQLPTSCSALQIGGAAFNIDEVAAQLAHLTRLRALQWCGTVNTPIHHLQSVMELPHLQSVRLPQVLGAQPSADGKSLRRLTSGLR